jgi:hypothetical protein
MRGYSPISYIHVSAERFIYSHNPSAYSAAGKYVERFCESINHSQRDECGNWD